MRPYSLDIRMKIHDACQRGDESQREVAARFAVSLSFVRDLVRLFRETGGIEPRPTVRNGTSRAKIDHETLEFLLRLVADQPHLSLSELCEQLALQRNMHVSRATVWRALNRESHRKSIVGPTQVSRKS